MISQGASKVVLCYLKSSKTRCCLTVCVFPQVNMSLIVNDSEAEECVKALHHSFFESGSVWEMELGAAFSNGKVEAIQAS